MKELFDLILNSYKNILDSINSAQMNDIYVFSFFVYNDNDDPRKPTLTIGYNTKSNFENERQNTSDENEARWNYAFWLQNELSGVGLDGDITGQKIIQDWIKEIDLYYTDNEEKINFDGCMEKGNSITKKYIALLIDVVKEIHSREFTNLPILIHELEYYDEIRDQNILANGEERVHEFTQWINDMYKQ